MKIVDISGFGHSGKTAVTDFLKQYDCVVGFPNFVEFELFRVPGGLLDLYFSIYESWNLIRSTVRINDFKKLVKRIGTIQSSSNPISYFTASGHGYDHYFNGRFIELSNNLINKIILAEQYTFWPYENLRLPGLIIFRNKLYARFFNSLVSANIYYSDRNQFIEHVQTYIKELFDELHAPGKTHVILNNAFDPFNPGLCLEMAGKDAYSIIVDRDPRDVYASQISAKDGYIPDFEKNKNIDKIKKLFTGFNDINQFIFRYRTIKGNVKDDKGGKVLRLRYEDFITDHENQSKIVRTFIGIDENAVIAGAEFSVSNSIKNIGLWKKYENLPEIKLIEKELKQYCYQQ